MKVSTERQTSGPDRKFSLRSDTELPCGCQKLFSITPTPSLAQLRSLMMEVYKTGWFLCVCVMLPDNMRLSTTFILVAFLACDGGAWAFRLGTTGLSAEGFPAASL